MPYGAPSATMPGVFHPKLADEKPILDGGKASFAATLHPAGTGNGVGGILRLAGLAQGGEKCGTKNESGEAHSPPLPARRTPVVSSSYGQPFQVDKWAVSPLSRNVRTRLYCKRRAVLSAPGEGHL